MRGMFQWKKEEKYLCKDRDSEGKGKIKEKDFA